MRRTGYQGTVILNVTLRPMLQMPMYFSRLRWGM